MHWWSYDCLAKAWRQRYCCEKWVLSKENWFVSTKCGQRGQCCVIHFSQTFRYIHYSEVVFLYQEHLYRFCPPFFTAKWYQNRDFFFPSLSTVAFDQCNWISWGFVAGTLGFGHFVPLGASVPVYSSVFHLHLQYERRVQSSLERDIIRRNMLNDCEFRISSQGFSRWNMDLLQTVSKKRHILFQTNSCVAFWHMSAKLLLPVSSRRSYYFLLLTCNAFTLPLIYVARNKKWSTYTGEIGKYLYWFLVCQSC